MRRFEVAMRAGARAAVPAGVCCACGRAAPAGTAWTRRFSPFSASDSELYAGYRFPLCDACAGAHVARGRFRAAGAALGFAAVLALWTTGWWERGLADWPGAAIDLVLFGALGMAVGALAGWLASLLAGAMSPKLRAGRRAARAVKLDFDGGRRRAGESRCCFRFANEEYARAFAEANGAFLDPQRG